jgi:alcohol dehydrogenase class IV
MNIFKRIFARAFQTIMRGASYFLDFRRPTTLISDDAGTAILQICYAKKISSVLLVTDLGIMKLGLAAGLIERLNGANIDVAVFDETVANPTISNIEDALRMYKANRCSAIIGFGGGSPIDCAKGVAARLARPKTSITKLRGLLKVWRRQTILIAVPTTAGTGSEATLAAVITDAATHEKYAINDPHLIPKYAVLDAKLTLQLPKHITATTGMDALTHATEAYIGHANTRKTKQAAQLAISLINSHLLTAYEHPDDLVARKNMQLAALEAGVAFTRAYVGHVHAIAHQLGGMYGVAHGLANAVILPLVLKELLPYSHKKLAQLARTIGLVDASVSSIKAGQAFITWIEGLNAKMNITNSFGHLIRSQDIPVMAKRAYKEAFPLYPVPQLWDEGKYRDMYRQLLKE